MCKWMIWGLDDASKHDSTNQILRDAQIIGCADMPQYADMPLLPLYVTIYYIMSHKLYFYGYNKT